MGNSPSAWDPALSRGLEFEEGLRALGWVEGQNVVIERRYVEGRYEQLPNLAAELVRLKVDVIVTGAGPASLKAAREATTTVPIVMVAASMDPVGQGLIQSFAHPGGNITGLVTAPLEVWGKRFELLREAVPDLSRVGLLWDPTIAPTRVAWERTAKAIQQLRVELLPFEVREPEEFDTVVGAAKERVGGLFVVGSPIFFGIASRSPTS